MQTSDRAASLTGAHLSSLLLSFSGAFLLFVVQPMLAKWLLPLVGGSAATWAACMVLYQGLLLAAYVYVDALCRRLAPRGQGWVHAGVVVVAAVALAVTPASRPTELGHATPALAIPWLLAKSVGLPFFALATTAPLVQRWAALASRRSPHSLYAVSNAGSLLGLLAYPLWIEPSFDLARQRALFEVLFWAYACAFVALAVRTTKTASAERSAVPPGVRVGTLGRWVALAFVPSALLLAVTNHLTLNIAAMPLLWVVPLALYLVSFIVAFSAWSPAWRAPMVALFALSAAGMAMNAFAQAAAPLWRQLGATLLGLFAAATLLHGELALDRPHPAALPRFYVCIAFGGALGGGFVSLVAPWSFSDYYELELAAIAAFALVLMAMRGRARGASAWSRAGRWLGHAGAGVAVPFLAASLIVRTGNAARGGRVVERSRSFLGPLRVVDVPEGRLLTHGEIQHGLELSDPAKRDAPTLYYAPETLVGRVLSAASLERRTVGAVGLGVGTIASYGRPGDVFRFYELDPAVVDLARRDFHFLGDSRAGVQVVIGDGRLALARERDARFDVLVLDAFSSDAVPVHLLTREAFALYAARLTPGGVLLVHVSNRYLSLDRVVEAGAHGLGLSCALVETPSDPARHVAHALWALVGPEQRVEALVRGLRLAPAAGPDVPWTDDEASLLRVLRST